MAIEYRVKVNLASGEIEVSGDRKFVDQKLEDLPGLLETLRNPSSGTAVAEPVAKKSAGKKSGKKSAKVTKSKAKGPKSKSPGRKTAPTTAATTAEVDVTGFKAEFKKYPAKISQNDSVLAAGLFVQGADAKKKFTSAEVEKLTSAVGKKSTNISVGLSQLRVGKKIERVGKDGRIVHYRVTPVGVERLEKVMAKA